MSKYTFPVVQHVIEKIYEKGGHTLWRSQSLPEKMVSEHVQTDFEENIFENLKQIEIQKDENQIEKSFGDQEIQPIIFNTKIGFKKLQRSNSYQGWKDKNGVPLNFNLQKEEKQSEILQTPQEQRKQKKREIAAKISAQRKLSFQQKYPQEKLEIPQEPEDKKIQQLRNFKEMQKIMQDKFKRASSAINSKRSQQKYEKEVLQYQKNNADFVQNFTTDSYGNKIKIRKPLYLANQIEKIDYKICKHSNSCNHLPVSLPPVKKKVQIKEEVENSEKPEIEYRSDSSQWQSDYKYKDLEEDSMTNYKGPRLNEKYDQIKKVKSKLEKRPPKPQEKSTKKQMKIILKGLSDKLKCLVREQEDKIKVHTREAILQVTDKDYKNNFAYDEFVKELRYDGSMDEIYLHKLTQGVTYKNEKGLVVIGNSKGPKFLNDDAQKLVQEQQQMRKQQIQRKQTQILKMQKLVSSKSQNSLKTLLKSQSVLINSIPEPEVPKKQMSLKQYRETIQFQEKKFIKPLPEAPPHSDETEIRISSLQVRPQTSKIFRVKLIPNTPKKIKAQDRIISNSEIGFFEKQSLNTVEEKKLLLIDLGAISNSGVQDAFLTTQQLAKKINQDQAFSEDLANIPRRISQTIPSKISEKSISEQKIQTERILVEDFHPISQNSEEKTISAASIPLQDPIVKQVSQVSGSFQTMQQSSIPQSQSSYAQRPPTAPNKKAKLARKISEFQELSNSESTDKKSKSGISKGSSWISMS